MLVRRRVAALIMSFVMLSSIFSMGAVFAGSESFDIADNCVLVDCCDTNVCDIRSGEIDRGDMGLPAIDVPELEDNHSLEDGYNPEEQSDYGEYDSYGLCNCECEYDCDYYDCTCECDCIYEDGYIEIMPFNTINVGDIAALRLAITNASTTTQYTINLTADFEITGGMISIPAGRDIILTGNRTLTRTTGGRHFTVNGTLRLHNVTLNGTGDISFAHGGVSVNSTGRLYMETGSTIHGNRAGFGGGGVGVSDGGRFTMNGGTISGNTGQGGGVFISNGDDGLVIMNGGIITGNGSTDGINIGWGGGARVQGGTFRMYGGQITGNTSGSGGGVSNSGLFILDGGQITGNTAAAGGGVSKIAERGSFIMMSGTISGNTAVTGGGGGIVSYGTGGPITINGGTISNNTANTSGGGISNGGAGLTINGGTITNNTAANNGGGVSGSPIVMAGGTISNNTAGANGGGISGAAGGLTISGGLITGNTATSGNGGGVNHTSGTFTMSGGEISGNYALNGLGGGINRAGGTFNMTGGAINNNTALNGGGLGWSTAAHLNNTTITQNATFSSNTATEGPRIDDSLNVTHNVNAGGRINPSDWTNIPGVANNLHAFNNFDIRTATGEVIHIYHSVTFNLLGGTGSFPEQNVRHNTAPTAPTASPVREYHRFLGWYTEAVGGVPFDFTVPVTSDTTVHARWESYVAVTFDLHEGTGNFPRQMIPQNTTATAPVASPVREYHSFLGWYTEAVGGVPFNFTVPITADVTVHARWESYVAITFDLHEGTGNFPMQMVPNNTTLTEPTTIPTRATYTFVGWYTEATGGTTFDFTTPITEGTIIHARWEPEYRYIRVYYMIDNENIDDIIINSEMTNYPDGYTYRVGDEFILDGLRAVDRNTLPGDNVYTFEGWYVFVGFDYHPTYLNFNRDVLHGSFVVPSASQSGLAPSSTNLLSSLNGFDFEAIADDWENQITLVAVWTINEAVEEERTPSTPPAGGGNQQGGLPATGIEDNTTLWAVLFAVTLLMTVRTVIWIVKSKEKSIEKK